MTGTRRAASSRRLLLAIALAVPIAGSGSVLAQSAGRVIRGTVLDTRDQPIVSATVVVSGGVPAMSDDSGRFRIEIAHRDRIVFDIRRIGFMPTRMMLAGGGDTSVAVLMLPAAQNLPTVDVKDAPLRPPGLAGFEQRMLERKRGAGTGHFITARDIEAMAPIRATQVVQNIPSIFVKRLSGERFAIYGRQANGGECAATIYLDGVRITGVGDVLIGRGRGGRSVVMRGDTDSPLDQYVQPSEIAGVEVYARGLIAPPQFQPTDPNAARCAIVVYWTKHAS